MKEGHVHFFKTKPKSGNVFNNEEIFKLFGIMEYFRAVSKVLI